MLAYVLVSSGPLQAKALANADVKQAQQLGLEFGKLFPKECGSWSWALMRAAQPAEAKRIAAFLQQDECGACARAVEQNLTPWSGAAALKLYWQRQLSGQEAEALHALKPFAERGVPLPVDVK